MQVMMMNDDLGRYSVRSGLPENCGIPQSPDITHFLCIPHVFRKVLLAKLHNDKAKTVMKKETHSERNDLHIQPTHPITKDTTMNETIIHPPHGFLPMFVIGTSRDINQLCIRGPEE